jgi:glycosyltransferase involved in cell wall biosynthesis
MKGHPPVNKILHVFGRLVRGGAQMRTVDLLRHIDRSRLEMHFLTLSDVQNDFDREIQSLGGLVHQIGFGPVRFPLAFRRLVRRHAFDVVHSHIHLQSGFVVRQAARLKVPTRIVHFRSCRDGGGNSPVRRLQKAILRNWIGRYATNILSVGEGAMGAVWGPLWRNDPRCRVVYSGLDPATFDGPRQAAEVRREFGFPQDSRLLIHAGRFVREKNHTRLLDIFATLHRRRADVRLLMVGWDPSGISETIKRRIRSLGLTGRAVVSGERRDIPRLLKAADLLVFPSLWEGLPGVVLESAAAGTPVLAADLPGVAEIAAQLPRIERLSLDQPDERWAQVAAELIDQSEDAEHRGEARRCFDKGVFTMDRYATEITEIWNGSSRRRAA